MVDDEPSHREEFADFYRAEVHRLMGFLIRLGASSHTAADLTQVAFTQAWLAWDSIHTNPRAWVRTVATRGFQRGLTPAEYPVPDVPDGRTVLSAEDEVVLEESTKAVRDLIGTLPFTQRLLLSWHLDGFTTAEIAASTDRTQAAVRQNLHRAKATLEHRLRGGAA
ncbi:RNA polymerase sigma factor [Actinokineospora sp. HUAS TT18]|uniref:RNA polymerase sigma factor n=1 Tax=Actinokineospora sp. HUAS TT18 TaxID=3447451 RepID=UPI003F525CB2